MALRTFAAASVIAVALAGISFWLSRQSNDSTLENVLSRAGETSAASASNVAAASSTAQITPASSVARSTPASPEERAPASAFSRRRALYAAAAQAGESRVADLIEEARALPDRTDRMVALEILLLRLLEQNPQSAVASALESEPAEAYHLLATLASAAPEQVWTAVAHVGDPLARMQYQNAIAGVWALKDPERAFANVADLPGDWTRDQLMRQMAWTLARQNPQLALELLRARPEHERNPLLEAVADQWSRQDPAAAAQWVEGLDFQMQGRLAYRIAGAFVTQQPEEALAWALRISRSPGRNLWSYMVGQIALTDPHDAVRRALAAENPRQRSQALSQALTAIAARDPAFAMSYVEKLPPGAARNQTAARVAGQLALSRPQAALDWVREFKEPQLRMHALSEIASQLGRANPDAAAQLIDRVPRDARGAWIQQVAQAYAESDVERGMQWIEQHQDEAPEAVAMFAQQVGMQSPEAAFEVAERITDEAKRDMLLAHVAGAAAFQAPELAARELNRISTESARAQAAGNIASAWGQFDPGAARKWVLSLASGPIRDTALSQFIPHAGSAEDSIELVDHIQSPELRMNAVFSTALQLARADPEGMRTLLRRHPLDPQRQQQLESIANRPMRSGAWAPGWR